MSHTSNFVVEQLEKTFTKFGYSFKNKTTVREALSHRSAATNPSVSDYRRLQFIGSAVLGLAVTNYISENVPTDKYSSGRLANLRKALTNRKLYAFLAARHGLNEFLLENDPPLKAKIDAFVKGMEKFKLFISYTGEVNIMSEGRLMDDERIPKALAEVFESLAGAIYSDSGKSVDSMWNVYKEFLNEPIVKTFAKLLDPNK